MASLVTVSCGGMGGSGRRTVKVCSTKTPPMTIIATCFALPAIVTVSADVTLVSVLPDRLTRNANTDEMVTMAQNSFGFSTM